jgi:hypothetical protein
VLVWNEIQVQEAVEYHSIPRANLAAVGAPVFDWMFSAESLQSREEFCSSVGLDPGRPYLLYAVSSPINCEDERGIVRSLHGQLERLAPGELQILVRPYPSNQTAWQDFTPADVRVGFPPLAGRRQVKINLYNTLYHAAAVVGLNTSVFLETAILGRPGLTLLFQDAGHHSDRTKHTQFPHFAYLLQGGFLEVAENEADCAQRIVGIMRGEDRKRGARTTFVQSFVRPNGLESPAGVAVADLLEEMAGSPDYPAADIPGRQSVSSSAARSAITI